MAELRDSTTGELMRLEAALAMLADIVTPIAQVHEVPLAAARGRVLAADLVAASDVPPHDNSAVDGYALRFEDLGALGATHFVIGGRAAAGHPLEGPAPKGAAVRIFTGAVLPQGLDTVVMQEDCVRDDAGVVVPAGLARGANARARGEDIGAGAVALARGRRLAPQDLGLAAALGRATLDVYRRLRVGIFSSGDELRDPGEALVPGKVHDANRYMLHALVEGLGCVVEDLGILPDDQSAMARALAAARHDVLLTSGGVSVGEEDHMRAAWEAAGGRLAFWRLAIKPGRPVAFGQRGDTYFLGLPGNPAAMVVCFLLLARPALLARAGATLLTPPHFLVRAGFARRKKPGRREFIRASLRPGIDGALEAHKFPREGAGLITSLVAADGLVELAEETTRLREGEMVRFLPFSAFA